MPGCQTCLPSLCGSVWFCLFFNSACSPAFRSLLVNRCCDISIPAKTLISAGMITSTMQTHNPSGLPQILCFCCVRLRFKLPSRAVNKLQAIPGCNPLLTAVSSCALQGPKRTRAAVHSAVHLVMSQNMLPLRLVVQTSREDLMVLKNSFPEAGTHTFSACRAPYVWACVP